MTMTCKSLYGTDSEDRVMAGPWVPPRAPASPRPFGRPYFIAANCPTHPDTLLVIHDEYHPYVPDVDEEPCECGKRHIWYDEWMCPVCGCQNESETAGIFLDWPDDDVRSMQE
jgi:hypothetical protein